MIGPLRLNPTDLFPCREKTTIKNRKIKIFEQKVKPESRPHSDSTFSETDLTNVFFSTNLIADNSSKILLVYTTIVDGQSKPIMVNKYHKL